MSMQEKTRLFQYWKRFLFSITLNRKCSDHDMFLNEVTVKWKLCFGKNNLVIAWEESANIKLFLCKIIKRYMNNLIECIWWPAKNLYDHNALVTQCIFSRADSESHGLLLHFVLLTLLGWYSNFTGFTCYLDSTLYALISSTDRFCFVVFFTIFQTNVHIRALICIRRHVNSHLNHTYCLTQTRFFGN